MNVFDAIASVLTGGATGLLGSVITRIADHKAKKAEYDHEARMKELDAAIMAQEWAHRTQVASIEAEAVVEKADAEAFSKSFNEPERYSDGVKPTKWQGWVLIALDAVRGSVRPGLTVYLCALVTYLYWDAHTIIPGLDINAATILVDKIVNTVLYLTTVVVCWWFGTRVRKEK